MPGAGGIPGVLRSLLRACGDPLKDLARACALRMAIFAAVAVVLTAGVGLADQADAAMLTVDGGSVALPATWDADMRAMVPDATLRTLMDREVRREFAGQNLASRSSKDVLAAVKGDGVTSDMGWPAWDLGKAYRQSGLKPIRLLNGVQYLSGVYEINARGLGLEALAMPGVPVGTQIPNLVVADNVFHIFPTSMYERNFPTTRDAAINPNQEYYHHAGVTYVRSGADRPKTVRVEAGVYQLADDAAAVKALEGDGTAPFPLRPILNRTKFGTGDRSFNRTVGSSVSEPDDAAWTVTGFDGDAKEGAIMTMAQYTYAVRHTDRNGAMDAVSLTYFYGLDVNFLSTVKHTASVTVLGDFSFRKTSASNPQQGLAGAEYVLRTADGRYVKGSDHAALYDDSGMLATTDRADGKGVLRLTTGSDGTFVARDLPASEKGVRYELVEVKAPDGYRLSANPVPVTVKANAGKVDANVSGGEGDRAVVTKDAVTAAADRWTSAATKPVSSKEDFAIDYTRSGEAMTLHAKDGSAASTARRAADYDGADAFIRNGGNPVTLGLDGINEAWRPLVSSSSVTVGGRTDAATVHTGGRLEAMAKAQRQINGIIEAGGMAKADDYYAVHTTVVYHDDASLAFNRYDGDHHTQADPANPIDVTVQARKHFLSDQGELPIESGRFAMVLEPQNGAPEPEGGTTSKVDAEGRAQWRLPRITWDVYRKAKGGDGTAVFRYRVRELPGSEPNIEYDRTVHTLEVRVHEREDASQPGTTYGLTATVLVNGTTAASGTSLQGAVTVTADAISFTNREHPAEELPLTGGTGILIPVTAGGTLLLAGITALIITARRPGKH